MHQRRLALSIGCIYIGLLRGGNTAPGYYYGYQYFFHHHRLLFYGLNYLRMATPRPSLAPE